MATQDSVRSKIDQATLAASEFSAIYHEAIDKRRQAINKIYREDAHLVWNGNSVTGVGNIIKFFDNLPVSQHFIEGMDTQPIIPDANDTDMTKASIVINFSGKIRFKDNGFKPFTQSIILSALDNKWKIVSDVFRFME